MKGLLARASAMRDSSGEESAGSDESRTSAGLQGSPFESREERSGSSASSDISTDRPAHTRESGSFESADTGPKSDVSGDNLASEAGPEYDQDSIVPDSDLHESVEFLDEEEFAQIAQEAVMTAYSLTGNLSSATALCKDLLDEDLPAEPDE